MFSLGRRHKLCLVAEVRKSEITLYADFWSAYILSVVSQAFFIYCLNQVFCLLSQVCSLVESRFVNFSIFAKLT